jgi:hypothetical protein
MFSRNGAFVGLLIVVTAAGAQAQSLAEAARKEKERRAKLSSAAPTKPITEDDLLNTGTGGGSVSNMAATDTSEPLPDVPPTGSRTVSAAAEAGSRRGSTPSGSGEAYWRGRAAQLRSAVASAEAVLQALEKRAAELGPPMPGPRNAPCQAGTISRRNTSAIQLRDEAARYGKVCDGKAQTGQQQDRVYADIERTRVALDRARAALAALDDEARRAGALPGWIR